MTLRSLSLFFISLLILAACGGGGGGSTPPVQTACSPSTTNLCFTVVGGKYVVQNSSSAGVSQKTLTLNAGTYTFDQTDSSNIQSSGGYGGGSAQTHQIKFSTTSDGAHNSGTAYTTGVNTTGTPGSDGKTTIVIDASTPSTLYYYCQFHSGMGGTINIVIGNQSDQVEFTETN